MLSNHRHTGPWSVWAARLRLQLSELWKGNKPNYLIGFLPLSLRAERNHWESRIRVNNEQKKGKKKFSRWNFESLSVCQAAGFAKPAGARAAAASERWFQRSFDNSALGIPPFGKRLTSSRNGVKFIREGGIKRRFQSFLPVTTRHPCRGAAGHLLPRGCSGNW